ncbi:MAG: NAD-dependent epimerase/dehydratase family protein [Rhodospirillales bacterium]|jgi:nucleoside-diphosphate-sugar epimerase|nr:NAD-dependent epimerase/dehydratase family protein [Rhodospirillales bacterium]
MAVLVTGGAGFVGLNLIERLLERGVRHLSPVSTCETDLAG